MATSKPDLQVHAARLRAIATDLLGMDGDSADVPALHAGAAALDVVKAAKSIADLVHPQEVARLLDEGWVRPHENSCSLPYSKLKALQDALAKLEAIQPGPPPAELHWQQVERGGYEAVYKNRTLAVSGNSWIVYVASLRSVAHGNEMSTEKAMAAAKAWVDG